MLWRQMVLKEANNSNIDNVTSTESSTSMLGRQMVLKEATKQANMGKKLCKYCKKAYNRVNTDSKMYICSGKGCKGPPSVEGGSDK